MRVCAALLSAVLLFLAGCAGPSTPLGAPWITEASQIRSSSFSYVADLLRSSETQVRFMPGHQVLHGPSPWTILVDDPAGFKQGYKLSVRHNGIDVTQSFLRQASISENNGGKQLVIQVPVIRLSPKTENLIEVAYGGHSAGANAYSKFKPPHCQLFEQKKLTTTLGFKPDADLLGLIDRLSKQNGFNPSFTAALIAQESSFNPRTVSWAKAIGLMQMTPVAEDEVLSHVPRSLMRWPRYPGLNEMSSIWVKTLILSGQVNALNEWRLDSERSIIGGLAYAEILLERWSTPENMSRIRELFSDRDVEYTKLVLASYNSGYTRVFSALNKYGQSWLASPELAEARYYVNRIFSYCDHFAEFEEVDNENET